MKGKNILLGILLVLLCIALGIGIGYLISNKVSDNDINDNENKTDNNETNILNSNIIVSKNGMVVSSEIPGNLIGKYVNKNSNESYIILSNDEIEVSEPTGGGATRVFKNNQVKLYINFLNADESSQQYVTLEFYVENNGYNQKQTYTYVGAKSSHDNEYHFKTIDPTPVGGEGNQDYPYSK